MKILFPVLLLFVMPRFGFSQAPASPNSEQSKILALENVWNQAEEHKDAKALETLLHPDLVYVD